jgi:hypothetical protein
VPHPQPIPLPPTAMCSFYTEKASLAASTPENKWKFHPWNTPMTVHRLVEAEQAPQGSHHHINKQGVGQGARCLVLVLRAALHSSLQLCSDCIPYTDLPRAESSCHPTKKCLVGPVLALLRIAKMFASPADGRQINSQSTSQALAHRTAHGLVPHHS